MNKIFVFLLSIIILSACNKEESRHSVYKLSCENRENPLGIDTIAPRLSWKIKSGQKGDRQTAWQVLAATSPSLLKEGKADLWDSGRIASPQSVLVHYAGDSLASGALVYWKVRVWNRDGIASKWSETAHFSVGLLKPGDWEGAYIGLPQDAGDPQCPLLRKQFEVRDPAEKTFFQINSLGYHEVYVNGDKVGEEFLAPAVSQFDKRSLARTYDISKMVKKGNNEIVIWLGRGWYQPGFPGVVYDGPLVKAQVETVSKGLRRVILHTDATWQASESGYTLTSHWRYHRFGGERIDARKAPANISAPELDKLPWTAAATIENVPAHKVTPQIVEGNRIFESYTASSLILMPDSSYLVDLGRTLTGMLEIKFPKLAADQEIKITYADHIGEDGRFQNFGQEDFYIASGDSGEVFMNKFNYHSFRYVKIFGLDDMPDIDGINGYMVHTDYEDESSFECSDPDMNDIHDMIRHTLHCLSLGGYLVDCNHIERLGYGGDGHASTLTAQTMFSLAPLYKNWLNAWEDCLRPDGGLPHTAPNPYDAGGGPYWCAFIISAPWSTYINYGDSSMLRKLYPKMIKWLKYTDAHTKSGLLKRWPDTDYRSWYLGDWATPTGVDQTNPASIDLVNNCVLSECYYTMGKIATLLGRDKDAEYFSARRMILNNLIHKNFFNEKDPGYATNSQIDLIYPMLTDATPYDNINEVTDRLFHETDEKYNGHLATGLVGIPVLVDWAVLNDQPDFVYNMLKKRDYPGYLYMIDEGATATWEHWNGERSHIHNCYNGIGAWFYRAIGGITTVETAPGYRKFYIDPQIPSGITWAKVCKETPYGTITVDWEKTSGGKLKFNISVPVGSTAVFPIAYYKKNYFIDGQEFERGNNYQIELPSGKYEVIL
ncbi:MAG: glycoside hydrolase family 78 protein [Tannerella sp.]|jgi:alpha-L-rhamnosidase|nr:glycoside hydrolase family 78 protein [Tannerella sp.]